MSSAHGRSNRANRQARQLRQASQRKTARSRNQPQPRSAASLLSHRRKLARAESHTNNIETLLAGWSIDGYRTFVKTNGKGRSVLFAELLKPLPDEASLILGDAFQCLRNSLDHLIFAISKKHSPAMTSENEGTPQFPVPRRSTAIPKTSDAIRFISDSAKDDVLALTPDPARDPFDEHPLSLLNKMSNRDKHRETTLVPVACGGTETFRLVASDGNDSVHILGDERMELGAGPVPLVEFARRPGVKFELGISIQILFDQGVEVADREVVPTLRWFHDHIRDTVFQRLEPHL